MTPNHKSSKTGVKSITNDPSKDLCHLLESDENPLINSFSFCEPGEVSGFVDGSSNFNILHLNIHFLPNKINELQNLTQKLMNSNFELHLIMLCETFINDHNVNRCVLPGYKLVELHRKNMQKGWCVHFVNDKLDFSIRSDLVIFEEGFFESCIVEIENQPKNILAAEIYRVPNSNEKSFLEKYDHLVKSINLENKNIVISTDQNLDFLKLNQYENSANFLDMDLKLDLLPMITRPTRITHSTATLIDNIYVKTRQACNSKSFILTSDLSDHLPCLLSIQKAHKPAIKRASKISA